VKLKIPVFVEKPLASSSIEAEKLVKLVKENNTILMVGYIERFNSAVAYLKQLIKNGELGEPILLEFHRENRWSGNVKDVGIVHDTSVHDIDTARWLFSSEPKSIFSRIGSVSKSHDDFVMIMLGFKEDKTAFITSNWITPKKTRELSAIFSNGIVKLDFITQELIIENNEGTKRPRINKAEPLVLELKNFIECIEGKSKPLITGKDALNTNRIADAVVSSSNTGSPIYLEL
jgi:UDP-N-acetylglucosamine 3-dehydrogenase